MALYALVSHEDGNKFVKGCTTDADHVANEHFQKEGIPYEEISRDFGEDGKKYSILKICQPMPL